MAIDEKEKAQLEAWKNCKCGGQFKLIITPISVAHTKPTCKEYEQLDLEKLLMAGPGVLSSYIIGMQKHKADT